MKIWVDSGDWVSVCRVHSPEKIDGKMLYTREFELYKYMQINGGWLLKYDNYDSFHDTVKDSSIVFIHDPEHKNKPIPEGSCEYDPDKGIIENL